MMSHTLELAVNGAPNIGLLSIGASDVVRPLGCSSELPEWLMRVTESRPSPSIWRRRPSEAMSGF